MLIRSQQRRGTAAAWTSANPILLVGELGFETDTLKHKLGDGSSHWASLAYAGAGTTVNLSAPNPIGDVTPGYGAFDRLVAPRGRALPLQNVAILHDPHSGSYGGSATQATYRYPIHLFVKAAAVRVVFGNFIQDPDSTAGLATIEVAAAIELSGVVTPLTFAGSASVSIAPGGLATSDPVTIPAPGIYFVRARPRVATSGQKWPIGRVYGSSYGGGVTEGSDLTTTGSAAVASATGFGYGPLLVIGQSPVPSVVIRGDSIGVGQSDDGSGTSFTPQDYFDAGIFDRIFNHQLPFVRWAQSGIGLETAMDAGVIYDAAGYALHSYGINQLGVNNLGSSLEVLQADMLEIWNNMKLAGLRVAQTTITPHDSDSANNSKRVALNNWIRSKPYPLDYVIDLARAAESSPDATTWVSGYSGDGVHPGATGSAALAAAAGPGLLADILGQPNTFVSPNGTRYKLQVANDGTLSTAAY